MRAGEWTQEQQLEHLVSKRDRMVSIYLPTDNPIWKNGRELVATVTVSTDDDGSVSIGLGHTPGRAVIDVQYLDECDPEGATHG